MKNGYRILKIALIMLSAIAIVCAMFSIQGTRTKTIYSEHLDDVAVTVDNYDIKFRELAFYILYEERVIEEQARIYNPSSTKDYWNIHKNDSFIQMEAKDAIIGMAIHDRLFYELAVAEGMGELSEDEQKLLEFSKTDFWEDLLDIQWTKLPCPEDEINQQIYIAAVAEKYQRYLAEKDGPSEAAYKYDGYNYSLIAEAHNIKINKSLWKNFVVGDITLEHSTINFINGLNNEDSEKSEN